MTLFKFLKKCKNTCSVLKMLQWTKTKIKSKLNQGYRDRKGVRESYKEDVLLKWISNKELNKQWGTILLTLTQWYISLSLFLQLWNGVNDLLT